MDSPQKNGRPWTRWWWFKGPLRAADIRSQLAWLADAGFGGVEIAWLYPLPGAGPGPAWLSEEWSEAVALAKGAAQDLGLGCDFTFGSLWPFGGTHVAEEDASRTWRGLSPQRLRKSWEEPAEGLIVDHLDRGALARYARPLAAALEPALRGSLSHLFCDSWEVSVEGLWTEGFGEAFQQRYGYDALPFMEALDEHPDVRYDYRRLLAGMVLREFYEPFTSLCHGLGARSRVQCHGAPTDLVAAYAAVDVPESEAILFDPHFSRFAASAAVISRQNLVSCETFTCLYGWEPYPGPGPHQGSEQVADMKLLADACFANGVNWIVWHGMPYNPDGGTDRFYASVHVGPDAGFADHLPAFNDYMTKGSLAMRRGRTYTSAAAYLPLEDAWMQGRLPEEQRRPSAAHHWELQHQRPPAELAGFHPLWVSLLTLPRAEVRDGRMYLGDGAFGFLYVDAAWLDAAALAELLRLARAGLPLCVKGRPKQPGKVKHRGYDAMVDQLLACETVTAELPATAVPLLEGEDLPEFWCREDDEGLTLFLAHPKTRELSYPMAYGQSRCEETRVWRGKLYAFGRAADLEVTFAPYQSVLLRVGKDGSVTSEDMAYEPPAPLTGPSPS